MPTLEVAELGDFGLVDIRSCSDGKPVAFTGAKRPQKENEAHALFIVTACNNLHELKSQLAQLARERDELRKACQLALDGNGLGGTWRQFLQAALAMGKEK